MPQMKTIPDDKKTKEDWDALPDVVVLHVSLVSMLVCARNETSIEDIEAAANREHATGIDSRWSVDDEVESQPCKDGRPDATHYVLSC